jgi:hypothetical protein
MLGEKIICTADSSIQCDFSKEIIFRGFEVKQFSWSPIDFVLNNCYIGLIVFCNCLMIRNLM